MTLSEFYEKVITFSNDKAEVYVFGVDEVNTSTTRYESMFCLYGQYKSSIYLNEKFSNAEVEGIFAVESDIFFVEINKE